MTAEIIFAGDRDLTIDIYRFLKNKDVKIKAMLIPSQEKASHDVKLLEITELEDQRILRGSDFRKKEGTNLIKEINPDYIISIHFPYIYPKEVLKIPKHGVVNLHPAYLPYNRGWHTPTWAIWEDTPYGATLHFMDENIDSGDIISRKKLKIKPEDTADSLYKEVKKLEIELFKDQWEKLANFDYERKKQPEDKGTIHQKQDIKEIQKINLNEKLKAEKLLKKLRALTTNKIEEAAYFEKNGEVFRVQVNIEKENC